MQDYKKSVLFICKNNAGRSQMAEGLLRHVYGDKFDVYSAGFDPKEISPLTIEIMAEIGVDVSNQDSKSIKGYEGQEFGYVVILCDENCPEFINAKKYIHHEFKDPKTYSKNVIDKKSVFRNIREEIKDWIENYFVDNVD